MVPLADRLIGRDADVVAVRRAVLDRDRVVVTGPSGIGKSAVARAAVAGSALRSAVCLRSMSVVARWPLRDVLPAAARSPEPVVLGRVVASKLSGDVLVVEDAHWADPETISVLQKLPRSQPAIATALADTDEVLALARAEWTVIELAPLRVADTAALVRATNAELAAPQVRRIVQASRGVPLVAIELASGTSGATVAQAVESRWHALSAEARLGGLAVNVIGAPTHLARLERVGMAPAAIKEARRAGLLQIDSSQAVEPAHLLVGQTVLSLASPDELRAAHRYAARVAEHPGQAGLHWEAAGDRARAVRVARRAAAKATTDRERAHHLALEARCTPPPEDLPLRLAAARELLTAEQPVAARDLLEPLSPTRKQDIVDVLLVRARAEAMSGSVGAARALLLRARRVAQQAGGRAEADVLVELTDHALWAWDVRTARRLLEETSKVARRGGPARRVYKRQQAMLALIAGDPAAFAHARDSVRAARAAGDLEAELFGQLQLAELHHQWGDVFTGLRLAEQVVVRAHEHDLVATQWVAKFQATMIRFSAQGPTDDVVEAFRLQAAEAAMLGSFRHYPVQGLVLCLVDRGDLDAAHATFASERWEKTADATGVRLTCAGELLWARGAYDDLIALVRANAEHLRVPNAAAAIAVPQAAACMATGTMPHVQRVHWQVPFARPGKLCLQGARSFLQGRFAHALRSFDEAASLNQRMELRDHYRARHAAAVAAAAAGWRDEARERLLSLEQDLDPHVWLTLSERVRADLRALGLRRPTRHVAEAGMSPRQSEVIELAGSGWTSQRIAAHLGLTEATVDSVVKDALRTTGARNRRHAFALLVRSRAASATERNGGGPPTVLVSRAAGHTVADIVMTELMLAGWMSGVSGDGGVGGLTRIDVRREADAAAALDAVDRHSAALVVEDSDESMWRALVDDLSRIVEVVMDPAPALAAPLDATTIAVVRHVIDGATRPEIAEALFLSERTVDRRLAKAKQVLGVSHTGELVALAQRVRDRWSAHDASAT